MMKNLRTLTFVLAILAAATAAHALTLLPQPQQIRRQGVVFQAPPSHVFSMATNAADPRVQRSLQEFLPPHMEMKEAIASPGPATIFVHATNKVDDITKEYCEALMCRDIIPGNLHRQGYFLGVQKVGDGALVLILYSDPWGAFYATKTLKQLYENDRLAEMSILDYPLFEARGILEGFYGKPWPEDRRTDIIPWLADHKYNGYMYAPKDDHKIRFGWRTSFSETEMKRFSDLAKLGEENFVEFCWELSPGVSVNYSSKKDIVRAYKKFKSIIDVGVDCVILAFDDVGYALTPTDQGEFDTYWQAQVEFSNKLLGKLMDEYPDLRVAFVPNDYWTELVEESEYLRYVGDHLDPRVEIGFTGKKIIPETVSPADAQLYEYYIRRKPFLGDNYPVTDNVTRGGRLSLGPLRNRDPRMYRYVSGFAANAMPLPEASKPAFLTIADYCWNPFAYDPYTSWEKAMNIMGGNVEAGSLLMFFAQQSESSEIWEYDALELFEVTRGLVLAFSNAPNYDFDTWRERAFTMFTMYTEIGGRLETIRNEDNTAMLDEMAPWIRKLGDYGAVGLGAVELLKSKHEGNAPAPSAIDDLEARWKKAEENPAVMTKKVMYNFMLQALALLRDQPLPEKEKYKSILSD